MCLPEQSDGILSRSRAFGKEIQTRAQLQCNDTDPDSIFCIRLMVLACTSYTNRGVFFDKASLLVLILL